MRRQGKDLVFSFVGKSGIEHSITISDTHVIESLNLMRDGGAGSTRLLAYKGEARWADLDAAAVNAYIAEMVAEDLTAKDFRTWHATVLAAVALAESDEKGTTKASQKRAVKAVEEAAYLGNTPTIARKSYIDPRVIDQYEAGTTIAPTLAKHYRDDSTRQAAIEKAGPPHRRRRLRRRGRARPRPTRLGGPSTPPPGGRPGGSRR